MAEQATDKDRTQCSAHVSMVPLHSSYPRAPYTPEKNQPRSLRRISPIGGTQPYSLTRAAPLQRQSLIPAAPPSGRDARHRTRSPRGVVDSAEFVVPEILPQIRPPRSLKTQALVSEQGQKMEAGSFAVDTVPSAARPSPVLQDTSQLPPGAALPPGMSTYPYPSQTRAAGSAERARRARTTRTVGEAQKKRPTFVLMMFIAIMAYTLIPRLVTAFTQDDPWQRSAQTVVEEEHDDIDEHIADPPAPIPMDGYLKYANTLPAHQSGSRENPASVGERLTFNDVAITVKNVERGIKAARAAWDQAPSGYEYVLFDLRFENPKNVSLQFSPVLLDDQDAALFPSPIEDGVEFLSEAQPDADGTVDGQLLFLVKTNTLYTLALDAYNDKYPVVFYAFP